MCVYGCYLLFLIFVIVHEFQFQSQFQFQYPLGSILYTKLRSVLVGSAKYTVLFFLSKQEIK